MALLSSLDNVPAELHNEYIDTGGLFGAAVYYPIYPGSATRYVSKFSLHGSTYDNVRQAFFNLSNDLYHIGVVDIDIEEIEIDLYRES